MFKNLLTPKDHLQSPKHAEGELYRVLNIQGRVFEIRYGYYEDFERSNPFLEPIPIYPNFAAEPQYTEEGFPFVTKMQDSCEYYKGKEEQESDCAECEYYRHCDELIGICVCESKKVLEQEEQK